MSAARRWARAVGLGVWLSGVCLGTARADSWLAACPAAYVAPAGGYRFIVMPRGGVDPQGCSLVAQQPEFADRLTSLQHATGTLERRTGDGWVQVWAHALTNPVSPVAAAVSDAGRVATFDNWHGVGWGDDVVVLFDTHGRLVRQMGLADFLPRFYVHALPRSVSSIWWGGDHAFTADGRMLRLQVVMPDPDPEAPRPAGERAPRVAVFVDAETGQVRPDAGPAWDQAVAQARRADAVLCADEVAWSARELAPRLPLSPAAKPSDWTEYGYDVLRRLRPSPAPELSLQTCVFNAADLAARRRVETCMREAFGSARDAPSEVLLIAPDTAALWSAAQRVLATLPAASLQGSHLYVAAAPPLQAAVTRVLSALGAAVTVFDPHQAVPITASAREAWHARFDAGDGRDAMGNCGPDARVDLAQ